VDPHDDLEELARRGERLRAELAAWLADCDRARLGLPNLLEYACAAMAGMGDLIRAKARGGAAG
jgi:hypothetical protein